MNKELHIVDLDCTHDILGQLNALNYWIRGNQDKKETHHIVIKRVWEGEIHFQTKENFLPYVREALVGWTEDNASLVMADVNLKENVDKTIKKNDIIFDIDWQGTKQLSKFKNLNLVKIFITTGEKKELKKRLIKRNQNSIEEIEKRFSSFDEDVKHWKDYDYVIINENLETCFKQIENIIKSEKKKPHLPSYS